MRCGVLSHVAYSLQRVGCQVQALRIETPCIFVRAPLNHGGRYPCTSYVQHGNKYGTCSECELLRLSDISLNLPAFCLPLRLLSAPKVLNRTANFHT
jgi:hypothetical protein